MFYLLLLGVVITTASNINSTEIPLFNPFGSLGSTTSDMIVTTDTIGLCKTGDVNNAQRLNVNIGFSVPGATQTGCKSFALGETFTLGHNSSDYLNLYDNAGVAHSSGNLLFSGVTTWVDTKLLPNNERWVTCGGGTVKMFSINPSSLVMTPHENSTFFDQSCVAAGAVGTDIGENMFTTNGTHFGFAILGPDDWTTYVNEQTLIVSSGTVQTVSAAYNNVVVARLTGADGLVAFYHDGSRWVEGTPFAVGVLAFNIEVAKNDATVFLQTDNTDVGVYKRQGDDWGFVGNFSTLGTIHHASALSLGEYYYADDSGNVAFVQLEELTNAPTISPSGSPTTSPTGSPTTSPTGTPTGTPTTSPTTSPTGTPTGTPTRTPTGSPTPPTAVPTGSPTAAPTEDEDYGGTVMIVVAALGWTMAIAITSLVAWRWRLTNTK